jgi:spore coat-associated protein N
MTSIALSTPARANKWNGAPHFEPSSQCSDQREVCGTVGHPRLPHYRRQAPAKPSSRIPGLTPRCCVRRASRTSRPAGCPISSWTMAAIWHRCRRSQTTAADHGEIWERLEIPKNLGQTDAAEPLSVFGSCPLSRTMPKGSLKIARRSVDNLIQRTTTSERGEDDMAGWPGVRRSNAWSQRQTDFGFRPPLRAPTAGRWLSEAMAEDRRYGGYTPDIRGGSPASHRWGRHAMTGAIAGLMVLGMVYYSAGGLSPDGGTHVFSMAAPTNTASAPEDSEAGGAVLGGHGHATEAEMAGGEGLVPGQAVERTFPISNRSDDDFGSVTLRTVATSTSLLDSDPVNGLQLSIDACSVPWQRRLDNSYSCPGRELVVLAPRAVIGDVALNGLSATRPGGRDHLRLTMSLPGSADNRFQGQRSQIRFTFTGRASSPA